MSGMRAVADAVGVTDLDRRKARRIVLAHIPGPNPVFPRYDALAESIALALAAERRVVPTVRFDDYEYRLVGGAHVPAWLNRDNALWCWMRHRGLIRLRRKADR